VPSPAASCRIVGPSNRLTVLTGLPSCRPSRAATWVASSESPPSSKKSSSRPSPAMPSVVSQTSATARSSGVPGGAYAVLSRIACRDSPSGPRRAAAATRSTVCSAAASRTGPRLRGQTTTRAGPAASTRANASTPSRGEIPSRRSAARAACSAAGTAVVTAIPTARQADQFTDVAGTPRRRR
jgi:hypothetical protein